MEFRDYDPQKDGKPVARIWREIGWIEKKEHQAAMRALLKSGHCTVAAIDDAAESMANTTPGTMRYLNQNLCAGFITTVATSRVARRQGLAARLTAHALALAAAEGAKVAFIGVFDQGYYNQLGFGNGTYVHWYTFDPAGLNIEHRPRIPTRLTVKDWEKVHRARLGRIRRHGGCSLWSPQITKTEMIFSENGFGLGYCDEQSGEVTHHFWCSTKAAEYGPYSIKWMSYNTKDQLYELLALIKTLGDQVHSVRLHEPPWIQLQDLFAKPFKARRITRGSKHENRLDAAAYWQARIIDLAACLEQTHLPGGAVTFNLVLTDPIEQLLGKEDKWRGIAGDYVVTLGPSSSAIQGNMKGLPTLEATVNALTRLWLGVRPASGLAWTDGLFGPPELLERLDAVLCLPPPIIDWDF
jgi:hypothetical protein